MLRRDTALEGQSNATRLPGTDGMGGGGGGHPYVQEVWGHCGVGGEEAGFECEAYLIEDAFCILAFRICKGRAPQGLSFHWQIFMNSDANMKYG